MDKMNGRPKQQRMKMVEAEELVKYMSNLPCYLQRKGRGGTIQEKALNFGVLDWNRLERWKHQNDRVSGERNARSSSSSSSSYTSASTFALLTQSGRSDSKTSSHAQQQRSPSLKSFLDLPAEDGSSHVSNERSRKKNADLSESMTKSKGDKHVRRQHSRTEHQKTVRKRYQSSENVLSTSMEFAASVRTKGKTKTRSGEAGSREEQSRQLNPLCLGEKCKNRINTYDFLSIREDFMDKSPEFCLWQPSHRSFSEDFNFEFNQSSDIPHSCPFPGNSQSENWPDITCQMQTAQNEDKQEEKVESCSRRKEASTIDPEKESGATTFISDANLNKTARSVSFREEASATGEVNSTFSSATCPNSLSEEKKESGNGRARLSPLRRILDPILKAKASRQPSSTEVLTSRIGGNLNNAKSNFSAAPALKRHLSFSTCSSTDMQEEHVGLKKHALLQIASQNGLPLFTFAFDGSDILKAVMMKVDVSGNDDFEWVYTFYSVPEVKNKSRGWINHGNKSKGHRYNSNAVGVVGQMKISSSYCQKLSENDTNNHIMIREFVLYGAEQKHEDHASLDFQPNNEIAAIVTVKAFNGKGSFSVNEWPCDLSLMEPTVCLPHEINTCLLAEKQSLSRTVVILPGGVHSQPATAGLPSRLIDRWRSGGSCDCGGWDVGCSLKVFCSQGHESMSLSSSLACEFSNDAHLIDLFIQGGAQEDRHVFSLSCFKEGRCSVDFNASVSLLQAFSICVAILHDGVLLHQAELHTPGIKSSTLPHLAKMERTKVSDRSQGEIPASYILYPPSSPVGRV